MKRFFLLICLLCSVANLSAAEAAAPDAAGATSSFLNWRERIQSVVEAIGDVFARVSAKPSEWVVNTAAFKGIFPISSEGLGGEDGVDQRFFLKEVILDGYARGKREFIAMNLGASKDFAWELGMKDFLLSFDAGLPQDISIKIIGVQGDLRDQNELKTFGNIKVYKISAFKLEDFKEALASHGLSLENKVDFICSHYTFTHLVDPFGTLIQAYGLLSDNGYLFFDGFAVLLENYKGKGNQADVFMRLITLLFEEANLKFLALFAGTQAPGQFLLQKGNEKTLRLNLEYSGVKEVGTLGPNMTYKTIYKYMGNLEALEKNMGLLQNKYRFDSLEGSTYIGDVGLYEWLKSKGLLDSQDSDHIESSVISVKEALRATQE